MTSKEIAADMRRSRPDMDEASIAHWSRWHPASGCGGWRVCRGLYGGFDGEHSAKNGRRITYRSMAGARRAADKLNAMEEA